MPISGFEFSRLMERLGPFEPAPELAVAVSGGPDSLALAHLTRDWAQSKGGRVHALIVDHGLRPESAEEAYRVGHWLSSAHIAHHILPWVGRKPTTGIQATARAARYRLLEGWCQAHGVLHLLLAHHRDDQSETFLLRQERGSGVYGLAAMAGLSERAGQRLLRPLLGVPKARLRSTLTALGQHWIEDPSNYSSTQARARLRATLPELERQGLSMAGLASAAGAFGVVRASLEASVADLLSRVASIHPAGFVELDPLLLISAPKDVAMRALGQVLGVVSGAIYPPRFDRLERLYLALTGGLKGGRTLAGCHIVPRRGRLLICREAAAVVQKISLKAGIKTHWDSRFAVAVADDARPGLILKCLGERGVQGLADVLPWVVQSVPSPARATLPSIWNGNKLVCVPIPLAGRKTDKYQAGTSVSLTFSPPRAAAEARFAIVSQAPAYYL